MLVREQIRESAPGRGSSKSKGLQTEAHLKSLVSEVRKRKNGDDVRSHRGDALVGS